MNPGSETRSDVDLGDPLRIVRRFVARAMILCAVFSLGFNILMLSAPIYMMQVFDRVLSTRNGATLAVLSLIAVLAILAMSMLDDARTRVLFRIGRGLERQLLPLVLRRGFSMAKVDDAPGQGLRDLATIRGFLGSASVLPFLDAPWSPLFLAVIYFVHPTLGHLTLAGGVVLLAIAICNNAATHAVTVSGNSAAAGVAREVDLASRNADTVRAMGLLDALGARWGQRMTQAGEDLGRGADRASILTAASKLVRMGLQVGIMGVGAFLVIQSEISPGSMLAASILLSRALAPVEQAIGSWRGFVGARHAWHKTLGLLSAPTVVISDMSMPKPAGHLTLRDVTHVPDAGMQPVLQRVSFSLEPGQSIGVAGPTGAGKSTLARLIAGAAKPTAGEIRLDGVEIATWADGERGPHVGYLSQEIDLFDATIRENIARMGEPDDVAVVAAARKAGIHEMILSLPDGYDTQLGTQGTRLSGGQKQRVALARALYGDPVLLVLDEPSSNLDLAGEIALATAVREACARGAVVVLIEHRPRIFQCVDQVLVLDAGITVDLGPTASVIGKLARTPEPPSAAAVSATSP
jgi:PrtD family type I secretion system ABC transporter